ncbi:uncharacterized protein LOC113387015 [Ctenocephalides felis]|uniref:uncharacterized protein LOC113387014 n=1 Tax=Ctenocephalides felis TaxID=7515 RepID=UPI000E6E4A47|nr:uncharacterized protein LOC113387014 [Ctenocephalides felis]XP_026480560.1 uncharacterized protein LOC113387015 [Ctenocephalides felis]
MAFIILYPAVAMLALFIVGVIMILLRYGPVLCKVRHHALPDESDWHSKTYEQKITYA